MSRYADPGPLDFDLFWVVFWDILNPALLNRALLNPALLNQALLNRALLNGALLNRRWWGGASSPHTSQTPHPPAFLGGRASLSAPDPPT